MLGDVLHGWPSSFLLCSSFELGGLSVAFPLGQGLFHSGAQGGCWPFSTQDPAGVFSLLILQLNIVIYKVHPGEV